MMDLGMVLLLAASYAIFAGFLSWCGSVIREPEGDQS
jgi:hypothetical protein